MHLRCFLFCLFFPKKQTFPNMLLLLMTVDIISKIIQDSLSFTFHLVPMQSFDSHFLHPPRIHPLLKHKLTRRTLFRTY